MNSILIITNKNKVVSELKKIFTIGYIIYNANSTEEALKILKNHVEIELVFLGGSIGEKEYLNFFKIIDEGLKERLTIMGISKKNDEKILNIMLDNGVEEFVCYPFREGFLRNRIKRILVAKECNNHSYLKDPKEKNELTINEFEKERSQHLKEIEELRKQMAVVLELSKRESLTNLYNRRTFEEKIMELIQSGQEGCIMMVDIDDFKLINDSRGHVLGDKILIELSIYFREFIKDIGFVARLGGDEFGFFLKEIKSAEEQLVMKDTLTKEAIKIGDKFNLEPKLTLSIGITCLTKNVKSFLDIYEVVDKMMYMNKTIRKE